MFTGYQYFVYFHTKTSHIVKVQKRATKFVISFKKYFYKDRLIQLNLPTLKYRRLRWDMIEVFQVELKQKYDTTIVPEISVNSSNCYEREQHPYLTTSAACMRDPACKRGPASIGKFTSESDPRPVCGVWCLSGYRLLSQFLR